MLDGLVKSVRAAYYPLAFGISAIAAGVSAIDQDWSMLMLALGFFGTNLRALWLEDEAHYLQKQLDIFRPRARG
jgi:hypothetical protein